MHSTSFHKQTDPAKQPGQIVNPVPAAAYKPAHGGRPTSTTLEGYIATVQKQESIPDYMNRAHDWVGFDFDRTLAYYNKWGGPDELGAPIPTIVELLKQVRKAHRVKIFTARIWPIIHYDPSTNETVWDPRYKNVGENRCQGASTAVAGITRWCQLHLGYAVPITCIKDIHCLRLYDDIAIQVVPNEGRLVTGQA